MHDLLVSYLLGEIDDQKRRLVEEKLRNDPALREKLEHLRHCLGLDEGQSCNEGSAQELPPHDLASRTSERVASVADSGIFEGCESTAFSSLGFASREATSETAAGTSSWTVADLTVATGVVLAIGMLLLPALRDSRCASRRLDCQDNLRELGVALANYSESNQRYMLRVRPNEHTGKFALYLVRRGLLDPQQSPKVMICPSSALAEEIRAGRTTFRMPSWEEFNASRGNERQWYIRTTGGSYAYRLGWNDHGQYRTLRNTYCRSVPILADAPNTEPTEYTSSNHGGCGQNVLFQDQSVRYVTGCFLPGAKDHFFLNYNGQQVPSDDPFDTVLAPSEARPQFSSTDKALRVQVRVHRTDLN
jgi:hypothetical protein